MSPASVAIDLEPGRYALGASAGADSTALAVLASRTPGVEITLVHLNHELRSEESDADEAFVRALARQLDRPLVVAKRSEIEPTLENLPANPSARYRAIRLALFRRVIEQSQLDAVLLAHHADDIAETVLLRLARGGGLHSLRGIGRRSRVDAVDIVRPLLHTRSGALRSYLRQIDQPWREDSSNTSADYARNVARAILAHDPSLTEMLIELSAKARASIDRLDALTPDAGDRLPCALLASLPAPVAEHLARRWLVERGAPADDVSPDVCARLVRQASDPTAPIRQHYPGAVLVRRRQKHLQ